MWQLPEVLGQKQRHEVCS